MVKVVTILTVSLWLAFFAIALKDLREVSSNIKNLSKKIDKEEILLKGGN